MKNKKGISFMIQFLFLIILLVVSILFIVPQFNDVGDATTEVVSVDSLEDYVDKKPGTSNDDAAVRPEEPSTA